MYYKLRFECHTFTFHFLNFLRNHTSTKKLKFEKRKKSSLMSKNRRVNCPSGLDPPRLHFLYAEIFSFRFTVE